MLRIARVCLWQVLKGNWIELAFQKRHVMLNHKSWLLERTSSLRPEFVLCRPAKACNQELCYHTAQHFLKIYVHCSLANPGCMSCRSIWMYFKLTVHTLLECIYTFSSGYWYHLMSFTLANLICCILNVIVQIQFATICNYTLASQLIKYSKVCSEIRARE